VDMFCYQCEQTWGGRGCDKLGVCGKDPIVASLQDLLVYAAEGISQYAHRAAQLGVRDLRTPQSASYCSTGFLNSVV